MLPTYNEAGSICDVVGEVLAVLERATPAVEVLVVDDDSPDRTADLVVTTFGADSRVRVMQRRGERGLAYSIRDGITAAVGERVIVMDADFNHDPNDLTRLLEAASTADLVSGSRFVGDGGMYSAGRQWGSRAMNMIIRAVVGTGMRDNLSGFFIARRDLLDSLPADRIYHGYGDYYFRLLWYVGANGKRLVEIPVVYRPREAGESKSPLLRMLFSYSWQACRFAWRR